MGRAPSRRLSSEELAWMVWHMQYGTPKQQTIASFPQIHTGRAGLRGAVMAKGADYGRTPRRPPGAARPARRTCLAILVVAAGSVFIDCV